MGTRINAFNAKTGHIGSRHNVAWPLVNYLMRQSYLNEGKDTKICWDR